LGEWKTQGSKRRGVNPKKTSRKRRKRIIENSFDLKSLCGWDVGREGSVAEKRGRGARSPNTDETPERAQQGGKNLLLGPKPDASSGEVKIDSWKAWVLGRLWVA